jgi:hypothetical protein
VLSLSLTSPLIYPALIILAFPVLAASISLAVVEYVKNGIVLVFLKVDCL